MASESSKEPVLASSPGTLQALIHEELRRVAKIVSRSTMEKLAGVRANFLYTAYIVKKDSYNSKNRKFNVKKTRKARNKLRNEEKSEFHMLKRSVSENFRLESSEILLTLKQS